MNTSERTERSKKRFLEAFAKHGTVTAACKAAGIGRTTHYDWTHEDPDYADQFEHARDALVDSLEEEAVRRARDGIEKGIYHQGELVAVERQYSDTLLIFLLKANRPDKYKERSVVETKQAADAEQLVENARAKVLQYIPGRASA